MDLNTAKGCTGCDKVLKNMRKISGETSSHSVKDVGGNGVIAETNLDGFLHETVEGNKLSISKIGKKSAKSKSKKNMGFNIGKY